MHCAAAVAIRFGDRWRLHGRSRRKTSTVDDCAPLLRQLMSAKMSEGARPAVFSRSRPGVHCVIILTAAIRLTSLHGSRREFPVKPKASFSHLRRMMSSRDQNMQRIYSWAQVGQHLSISLLIMTIVGILLYCKVLSPNFIHPVVLITISRLRRMPVSHYRPTSVVVSH